MNAKKMNGYTPMTQPINNEVRLTDVIRIALPANVIIQCTQEQTRQKVNWVTLVTSRKNVQVQAGDIALIPSEFQAQLTNAKLGDLLRSIAVMKAVGVVLFNPASAEVKSLASQARLPLIEITENKQIREVHKDIAKTEI